MDEQCWGLTFLFRWYSDQFKIQEWIDISKSFDKIDNNCFMGIVSCYEKIIKTELFRSQIEKIIKANRKNIGKASLCEHIFRFIDAFNFCYSHVPEIWTNVFLIFNSNIQWVKYTLRKKERETFKRLKEMLIFIMNIYILYICMCE